MNEFKQWSCCDTQKFLTPLGQSTTGWVRRWPGSRGDGASRSGFSTEQLHVSVKFTSFSGLGFHHLYNAGKGNTISNIQHRCKCQTRKLLNCLWMICCLELSRPLPPLYIHTHPGLLFLPWVSGLVLCT